MWPSGVSFCSGDSSVTMIGDRHDFRYQKCSSLPRSRAARNLHRDVRRTAVVEERVAEGSIFSVEPAAPRRLLLLCVDRRG